MYRSITRDLKAATGDAQFVWQEVTRSSGEAETIMFSRQFEYPDDASFLTLHLVSSHPYLLYLNRERMGSGMGGIHTYEMGSIIRAGENRVDMVVFTPNGYGYLLGSMDLGGIGNNVIYTNRRWSLQTREGLRPVMELGKAPLPGMPPLKSSLKVPLFPTFAGGDFPNLRASFRKGDWQIYDFGESFFAFPVLDIPEPVSVAWGEELDRMLEEPPLSAVNFPGLNEWTTVTAHHLRYIGVSGKPAAKVRIRPVTGPYPAL